MSGSHAISSGPRCRVVGVLLAASIAAAVANPAEGQQQCGSALLAESQAPAVFDGLQLTPETVSRYWEQGAAASAFGGEACLDLEKAVGCASASGALCAGGTDCVALTGVHWLNSFSCATAGHTALRTVILIEQPTLDSGGRWAAINLASNAGDANYDLDQLAQTVCGSCASVASPYLGGGGAPVVDASSITDGVLAASLSWSAPSTMAQLLSDGDDLVTSYTVYYQPDALGTPPAATGDKGGWIPLADLEADGAANGGHSTDTNAEVEIALAGPIEEIYFAVGLNFDGSGDPSADGNTLPSSFVSDSSLPVNLPPPCGETNHVTLENQTVAGTQEFIACYSIIAGDNFVVDIGAEVTFRAGFEVSLQDGFSVDGGTFRVQIDPSLAEF